MCERPGRQRSAGAPVNVRSFIGREVSASATRVCRHSGRMPCLTLTHTFGVMAGMTNALSAAARPSRTLNLTARRLVES